MNIVLAVILGIFSFLFLVGVIAEQGEKKQPFVMCYCITVLCIVALVLLG